MIQPILLYNAEIWGAFIWPKNTRRAISHSFTNIKHKFETLHTKLCKNALGVHKKSSDIMVMAELGRYPLMSNIIKHIYTYWQHILHARDNLLHKTLEYLILSDRLGHVNYYSRIKALFFMLNQSHLIYQCDHKQIKTYSNTIKNAYNKLYNEHFFKTLEEKANRENSGGRYELYHKVKKNYTYENYLNLNNNKNKRNITNIRISTHNLPIEKLRKQNIPRKDRICTLCNTSEIGSEEHIIIHCKNNEIIKLRETLHNKLKKLYTQWEILPKKEQFIYLITASDPDSSHLFSIFLDKVYKLFKRQDKK